MHIFKWIGIALAIFLGCTRIAFGQLDTWTTWSTTQPYVSKQVPPAALVMRGIGTDAYYPVEVNATTGAIPVDLSGGTISIDYSGPTGSPVPADAAFVGGTDGTNLRGIKTDTNGELQVDILGGTVAATQSGTWTVQPGNTANTTPWLTTISQGGNAATVSGAGALKVDASGSTQPVSGTVAVSNLPSTVDTNVGAAGSSTLRVSEGSRTYSDSVNKDYAGGNVTTGAWTQLIASTAAAINLLCLTDTSGQVMELGTGSAASETRVFLIAQGWSGCIPLRIAASTRVSVRAVTATASSGYLTISGMN